MVPEVINWEAVRCITIDGTIVRLVESGVEHEIAFPTMEALNAALEKWAVHSAKSGALFRDGDFPFAWPSQSSPSHPS